MDFTFDEDQLSVRQLANDILSGPRERLWPALAETGLIGIALPEELGGSGASFTEFCLLVEAGVPLIERVLLVAEFGTREQRARLIPPVCAGDSALPAALEPGRAQAVPDKDGWRLSGEHLFVPQADRAQRILVAADDGLFLVDPAGHGVELRRQDTLTGEPEFALRLDDAVITVADVLRPPGESAQVLEWLLPRITAAYCVQQAGCAAAALDLTAEHLRTREQFGRPLGAFQAARQRIADAYIDVEGMRLTAWQAAWRLTEGRDAAEEVEIAAWWACDAGPRVLHTAQHLHGGLGTDLDYPLHRYFLEGKRTELILGGASARLLGLGELLAVSRS
ncbi:acyl-CoA dehydrogenase family protein [Planobispora longispora]|uniref:Acyl-CoA dehydrogenase n=1 Tax=Planobispora longispora TaxID=28887 RepID=A0A8J3RF59_9ACTN|nr:acyl-CoA dehydrogenase family protein [Planobispora longispora]BFE78051.1 acyl-CoA dehydrogenase family protein [Planobispora longispora]GIH73600.1 acyl-CoA dehydrogenase [Planobispora longispora]